MRYKIAAKIRKKSGNTIFPSNNLLKIIVLIFVKHRI